MVRSRKKNPLTLKFHLCCCGSKFLTEAHRMLHCTGRPKDSECRTWYLEKKIIPRLRDRALRGRRDDIELLQDNDDLLYNFDNTSQGENLPFNNDPIPDDPDGPTPDDQADGPTSMPDDPVDDPIPDDPIPDEERQLLDELAALGLASLLREQPNLADNLSTSQIGQTSGPKNFSKIVQSRYYEGAAQVIGSGSTFKDTFHADQHANIREETNNIYYPMSSFMEWEFTNILLRLPISQNWKNILLATQLVSNSLVLCWKNLLLLLQIKNSRLTYSTIQGATERIAHMPSGPNWYSCVINVEGYQPAEPIILHYRDAAECAQYLLHNPLFADHQHFIPVKHFDANGNQVINEAVSAKQAWETQVCSSPLIPMLLKCNFFLRPVFLMAQQDSG